MDEDILKGKWALVRGQAKNWWEKLTDDDLDKIRGKFEGLASVLQERYGFSREAAVEEINRRIE